MCCTHANGFTLAARTRCVATARTSWARASSRSIRPSSSRTRAARHPTIADGTCDPNGHTDSSQVTGNDFAALPTGGTSLSRERRVSLSIPDEEPAGPRVRRRGVRGGGSSAFTNGKAARHAGFRRPLSSPVGPIRVDLGIRPSITDHLTVITESVGSDGAHRLVELDTKRDYNPVEEGSGISKLLEPPRAPSLDRAGLLMWKILKIAGITIAVVALLIIGAILGLTNTDFGRERVRRSR